MKTFKQVEGILYSHYKKIETIDRLNSRLNRSRQRAKVIKETLRDCKFTLDGDMEGIDYSKDKVQSSNDNSSSMEQTLIREETRLEKELEEEIRHKFKLKRKIRNTQKEIDNIELILETLPLNYVRIIKLLYKEKLTYRNASLILHCDPKTVGNNKKEVIGDLTRIL